MSVDIGLAPCLKANEGQPRLKIDSLEVRSEPVHQPR